MNQPGTVAEEGELLLQIDVQRTVEDPVDADVVLVGADRRVGRDQRDLVTLPLQGSGQGVVVQARPAVHAGGAGRDVPDPHPPKLSFAG